MIRVVVAEDETLLRSGLSALAGHDKDIEIVAEVGDGDGAVAAVRAHQPDVVLMDVRMPGVDGITATQRIHDDPGLVGTRVLVLTTFGEDDTVADVIRAGAAGYLLKDVGADDLRTAIRTVASGEPALSSAVTASMMRTVASSHDIADPALIAHLASREREVLTLVGQGLNNAEIAEELIISPATARTYVSRLLTKLDARDRAQLVTIAYRSGLVTRQGRSHSDTTPT